MSTPHIRQIRSPNGEYKPYRLCVLRVTECDLDTGRPREFSILREGEAAELSEDPRKNEFLTAYLPADLKSLWP